MARAATQRSLTIYLVNKALTDLQAIVRAGSEHHEVIVNGRWMGDLFVKVGHPHPPPWVSFFSGAVDNLAAVQGMSTSAVLWSGLADAVLLLHSGLEGHFSTQV
jgi:hypothetical protein